MNSEKGQTQIGIAILVTIVIIVLLLCGLLFYFSKGLPQVGDPLERAVEYQVDYVEDVPIDNCDGNNQVEYEDEKEYAEEHLINVHGEGIGGIEAFLISQKIEVHYGVQNKEIIRQRKKLHFSAGPGENIIYHIKWTYMWKKGDGVVKYADGSEEIYQFGVRTQLNPDVAIEKIACSP
ncbi:MAG: hypothetical protein HZB18_07745 [Chloroflexi bacterium]|nr:hypothetical protein [Chloroflexota bacterium]